MPTPVLVPRPRFAARRHAAVGALGFALVASATPARAQFKCAVPAVTASGTDSTKAIVFEFQKAWQANPWLGKADGIMCMAPDGRGRFWHATNGSIYWSPETGARTVRGLIRQRWAAMGWERGALGYPMTDEITTYDGLARVSKFQGGQLIWRPWTNQVTAVMTADLQLDLPTPTHAAWRVIQANARHAGDSHGGPWVYCYDFGAADGASQGRPFLSTAHARVVQVLEGSDSAGTSNVVVQHLGLGRYASSLHVQQQSYSETFGSGKAALTLATPWPARPFAQAGATIARVGKTGASGDHIHFCVTTAPDGAQFAPFESVPFAFRDYEQSVDGITWTNVALGRPAAGALVRHGLAKHATLPAELSGGENGLTRGAIAGTVRRQNGTAWAAGSILVQGVTGWGEPVGPQLKLPTTVGSATPVAYQLPLMPNYPSLRVRASFVGAKLAPGLVLVSAESAPVTASPTATVTAHVVLPF